MEVELCVQKTDSYTASLLARLNLQRQQAHFCDCVVRQRQNPGQLYPAHRCVLAASSPVLASILSSSSALVELQAPCLSESVLALVLDFMYTGDLPSTHTQQQYYNLFTAACYLQMDELQKTLRTEVHPEDKKNASSGAENQPYKDINNTNSKNANTFRKYLPLSDTNSPQRKDQYCDGINTCRSSSKTGANHHSRKDASPLSNVGTGCGVAESTGNILNIDNCREVTYLTPQKLIQNIPCTTEVNVVSRVDKEVQKHQFHSADTVKPECWQMITEEELVRTVENRRSLYSEEEMQEEQMSRAQETQCLTVKSKAEEKQTNRKEEDKICHSPLLSLVTSNLKETVSPSQCSSSSPHPCCGAVTVIRHSSTVAMAEVSTMSPYHRTASMPPKKDFGSFNDIPSKYQRLDCSDCHNVLIATAAEEQFIHSQDPRIVVDDSDEGSDSHCEGLCPEGEVKEEHSYSSKCPAEMDRQDIHWNLYGQKNDPSLHRAEMSTKDAASSQREHDNKETAMDNVTGELSAFERCTSLEHENISGTEISESHLTFTMPVDNNVSDPSYAVVGQSYCGHLRYHCLPQENTNFSHGDSNHKHSNPGHAGYSDQPSDEEEDGTFASPGLSPLRKHFAATDQILLLDISAKPAELLVSYRQRSDEQQKLVAFSQKDTFANELGDNDREQHHEATSVAGVNMKEIRAGSKIFDEAETLVGETTGKERKSLHKEPIRPGVEVIHKAGVVEGENRPVTASTVCSPHCVTDSVQAPVSSTSSVCIASTLSASMPTNISAPLSTPVQHPFQCSLCDRSFSQRGSLNRHVRSHLGVRPFPCPRCPMTFSRQYRVSEHMRVHQRCVLGSDFQKPPAPKV